MNFLNKRMKTEADFKERLSQELHLKQVTMDRNSARTKELAEQKIERLTEDQVRVINGMKNTHSMEIERLKHDHEMEIKEKEFEITNFKDIDLKKMQTKVNELESSNAVFKKENEMLVKLADVDADIIDVKDIITKLITALPKINLENLAITSNSSSKS